MASLPQVPPLPGHPPQVPAVRRRLSRVSSLCLPCKVCLCCGRFEVCLCCIFTYAEVGSSGKEGEHNLRVWRRPDGKDTRKGIGDRRSHGGGLRPRMASGGSLCSQLRRTGSPHQPPAESRLAYRLDDPGGLPAWPYRACTAGLMIPGRKARMGGCATAQTFWCV